MSDARRPSRPFARRAVIAGAAAAAAAAAPLALIALGCAHPKPPVTLVSTDTNARIAAIKRAGLAEDVKAAPLLVDALEDDDPAVRFFAIEALARIAGDRMGYDYFEDDAAERKPAVARWRAWLDAQGLAATTRPAGNRKR